MSSYWNEDQKFNIEKYLLENNVKENRVLWEGFANRLWYENNGIDDMIITKAKENGIDLPNPRYIEMFKYIESVKGLSLDELKKEVDYGYRFKKIKNAISL